MDMDMDMDMGMGMDMDAHARFLSTVWRRRMLLQQLLILVS